jgi:choline kinase
MDGLILATGNRARRHQLNAMHAAGAQRLTVVSSRQTGTLHAFSLARERVHGDVLVLSSDALFPQQILRGLLHRGSALAFDSRSRAGSERVEVSTKDGRLIRIGGDPSSPGAHGEHLGLLHLTEDVARATFDVAAELLQRGGERLSLVTALNVVARRHSIACVDIADLRWVEIDYPKDLPTARTEVWPAVAELRSRPPARARTGRAPEKRAAAFPSHA